MAQTKITAPVAGYNGDGPGGLKFENGVAHTDDEAIINYCLGAGYGVGKEKPTTPERPTPEVDSRNVPEATPVGSRVRDASVDPHDDDFLPPVNAGKADPHGPDVVAPGIHALPPAPIVPGEVPDDPAAQQRQETDAAQAVLIDGEQPTPDVVSDVVDAAEEVTPAGPLELSDPGSADQAAGDAGELPSGNASQAEWAAYAVRRGMPKEQADALSRNELRDKYAG